MKVLAIDTSTSVAGVAVMEDQKLLGEMFVNHQKTHSQKLMIMVKQLMNSLDITPKEIDIYAASTGPGSFTGLRIGVTTIKTMAFALEKPVISVPTLDSLAYNIHTGNFLVCPIMDARNRQVYTSLYKGDGNRQNRLVDYMGVPIEEIVQIIKQYNEEVVFVGDGVELYEKYLMEELGEKALFPPGFIRLQRASTVAQLALLKASSKEFENCYEMLPFYLRKSQAEREYEKRHQQ